jgi:hypothetical protein
LICHSLKQIKTKLNFNQTYTGVKVQLVGKGGHDFPLEEGVPGGALIEVAAVDEDGVRVLGPEVLDGLREPSNSSETF